MDEVKHEDIDRQTLIKQLADRPWDFHFIKAVEAIESRVRQKGLVGQSHHPVEENLRFRANPSLGFAPADIASFDINTNGTHQLSVNFMGLYGPSSPLPTYFTENVIYEQGSADSQYYYLTTIQDVYDFQRQRLNVTEYIERIKHVRAKEEAATLAIVRLSPAQQNQLQSGVAIDRLLPADVVTGLKTGVIALEVEEPASNTLRDFFDVFNHRLISLFYRASRKYRPYRDYFNPSGESFYNKVYALIGAPDHKHRSESLLHWPKLMRFAGLLAIKGASKEKLLKVVKDYFALTKVEVIEGCQRTVTIAQDQRVCLGVSEQKLGYDFVIGTKIADNTGLFRLKLSELSDQSFQSFLPKYQANQMPEGENYGALKELVSFLMPSHLLCEIELQLKDGGSLDFTIGRETNNQLGISTWFAGSKVKQRSVTFIL